MGRHADRDAERRRPAFGRRFSNRAGVSDEELRRQVGQGVKKKAGPKGPALRRIPAVAATPLCRGRLYLIPWHMSVMQIDCTVRFAGGTAIPRSAISLRMRVAVSGRATADCTPTRTSPSE